MVAPHADLNYVLATIKEEDALRARAAKRARAPGGKPVVTFAVGIELLLWCRKNEVHPIAAVDLCVREFETEKADILATAAHAMQKDGLRSPLDAVHLAEALHAGTRLLTADERLWKTRFPTEAF